MLLKELKTRVSVNGEVIENPTLSKVILSASKLKEFNIVFTHKNGETLTYDSMKDSKVTLPHLVNAIKLEKTSLEGECAEARYRVLLEVLGDNPAQSYKYFDNFDRAEWYVDDLKFRLRNGEVYKYRVEVEYVGNDKVCPIFNNGDVILYKGEKYFVEHQHKYTLWCVEEYRPLDYPDNTFDIYEVDRMEYDDYEYFDEYGVFPIYK